MARIELSDAVKTELVQKLQRYIADELHVEVGSFDAEFLLDFFNEQMGGYFYNQGLADALASLENKLEEITDTIYQLEQAPPT